MDEVQKKADYALLEGDREEVLQLLSTKPALPSFLWLRAQSARDEEQRQNLLRQVVATNHPVYARLASATLEREQRFDSDLHKPPEYQFWKKPKWQTRINRFKRNKKWWIGVPVALVILGILIYAIYSIVWSLTVMPVEQTRAASIQKTSQALPKTTPTVTALPTNKQGSATYPAGRLTLLRIESPTTRQVTTSIYATEKTIATPALGSQFVAYQLEFRCQQVICENPPEAELGLKLSTGNILRYQSASRPVLIEQPGMSRISNSQSVTGWFVFEVPISQIPASILVYTGDQDPVLEIQIQN